MSVADGVNLLEVIKAFPEFGKYIGYKPVSEGHINDTYIVEYEDGGRLCLTLSFTKD